MDKLYSAYVQKSLVDLTFVNIDNEEEKLQPHKHKITTLQNLNSLPFIICTPTQLRQE